MRISSWPHTCIYVTPEVRDRIRQRAIDNKRSLITEVSITLLTVYRPRGWAKLIKQIEERSRRTRRISATEFSAEREYLSIHVPPSLKEKIAQAAKDNFRSFSAEAYRALAKEYR